MKPPLRDESRRVQVSTFGVVGGDAADGSANRRISHRDGLPHAGRAPILLVEDDAGIRGALQGLLEDEGYRVTTAENGQQALDRLRAGPAPRLIVLDLRMPVMDGWEFRAAQKNDPTLAKIPVLAVSADRSAQAAAIDAEAYLHKPLSTDALLNAVARVLGDRERQQLRGRLEEAERFAALGRLAASVGHEINNPLAFVSMNVDLAVAQLEHVLVGDTARAVPPDLSTLAVVFRECRVGLDRIREVVKDLQRLSRRAEVRREPFDLNTLLDESYSMARTQLEHRGRVQKLYGQLPRVVGDRSALGQVLLNLILNAVQALPDGHAETNEVTLKTSATNGHVTVEVSDTGDGIPAQILPHIFDPFYTTKPIGEGTGLGLAVSLRIVADHGGRIDVESEVGRGATFRVILPITDLSAVAPPPLVTTAPQPPRARILVVDDMLAFGRTIARALREHEVIALTRADEVFARLAAGETFDLILCDVEMPELSGRAFHERLNAEWPQLAGKMIFMTGGAFTAEGRDFLERAPRTVLTKPFLLEELRAAIGALLERTDRRN